MPILTPQASDSGGMGSEFESMGSGYLTGIAPIFASGRQSSFRGTRNQNARAGVPGASGGFRLSPLIL